MKRIMLYAVLLWGIAFFACQKEDDDKSSTSSPTTTNNSPTADQIADALFLPSGTEKINASFPLASDSSLAPILSISNTTFDLVNNSTNLFGDYSNVSRKAGGLLLQVKGSSYYYRIPIKPTSASSDSSSGSFSIPIAIQPGVTNNDIALNLAFYDTQKSDYISTVVEALLKALSNQITGYLKVGDRTYTTKQKSGCGPWRGFYTYYYGNNPNQEWVLELDNYNLVCDEMMGSYNLVSLGNPSSTQLIIQVWLEDSTQISGSNGGVLKNFVIDSNGGSVKITNDKNTIRAVANNLGMVDHYSPDSTKQLISFDITVP